MSDRLNSLDDHDAGETAESDSRVGTNRRIFVRLAKFLVAVVVVLGLVWAGQAALQQWRAESEKIRNQVAELEKQIEQSKESERPALRQKQELLRKSEPSAANLRWDLICLACLLYALGLMAPGLVLQGALRSLGESAWMTTTLAAQLIGHAGKYVPGKAIVIVLRVAALSSDNVRPVQATICVFMETLLMMAVGAALAGVVICQLPVPSWMVWSAIGVAIAASIPTFPPILARVAARVSKIDIGELQSNGQAASSTYFFVNGWFWSLVAWIFIGSAFTALVLAIPTASELPSMGMLWAVSTASIALAVVIGFASLLPGGIGVRELALTTVLATSVGPVHALLAAIAARIMFIAVESGCAAAAWWWLRKTRANYQTDTEST